MFILFIKLSFPISSGLSFSLSLVSLSLAIVPYLFYLSFSLGSHGWPSQYQPHQSLGVIENIEWLLLRSKTNHAKQQK